MSVAPSLISQEEIQFYNPPNIESKKRLDIAYKYIELLKPKPFNAIIISSSVACGNATPASDIDIGFVIPNNHSLKIEKTIFNNIYIDHCEWYYNQICQVLKDPLHNIILSYMIAFSLILYDNKNKLSAIKNKLSENILSHKKPNKWIHHYLNLSETMKNQALDIISNDKSANIFSYIFESVRRSADALKSYAFCFFLS